MTDGAFPTFCHIGQYGDAGYRALPRLLAMSKPLNLWAPVAAKIANAGPRVTKDDFLNTLSEETSGSWDERSGC